LEEHEGLADWIVRMSWNVARRAPQRGAHGNPPHASQRAGTRQRSGAHGVRQRSTPPGKERNSHCLRRPETPGGCRRGLDSRIRPPGTMPDRPVRRRQEGRDLVRLEGECQFRRQGQTRWGSTAAAAEAGPLIPVAGVPVAGRNEPTRGVTAAPPSTHGCRRTSAVVRILLTFRGITQRLAESPLQR
jgi:hypothetical protein